MIHWLQWSLKDIRSEMRMEYSVQKQNMAAQHHEIKDLKTKCKHLQEVVNTVGATLRALKEKTQPTTTT